MSNPGRKKGGKNFKWTTEHVRQIKEMSGIMTGKEIAAELGVTWRQLNGFCTYHKIKIPRLEGLPGTSSNDYTSKNT